MIEMMNLPYAYNELEPDINEEVISTHFNKHYKGYVDKLNELLKQINYNKKNNLMEIPTNIDDFPLPLRGDILYNTGGVLNHELYFNSMNPIKSNPKGSLLNKINIIYGNFEEFRKDFISRAKSLVGSGYTFLVSNNRCFQNIFTYSSTSSIMIMYLYTYLCLPLYDRLQSFRNH